MVEVKYAIQHLKKNKAAGKDVLYRRHDRMVSVLNSSRLERLAACLHLVARIWESEVRRYMRYLQKGLQTLL